jgi:hypothetical protein
MLSVTNKIHYAECHYATCRYAECRSDDCRGAQYSFGKNVKSVENDIFMAMPP